MALKPEQMNTNVRKQGNIKTVITSMHMHCLLKLVPKGIFKLHYIADIS